MPRASRPVSLSTLTKTDAQRRASDSRTIRARANGSPGAGCPVSSSHPRKACGMSVGWKKRGSSGKTNPPKGGADRTPRETSSEEKPELVLRHDRRHSSRIQRPITFFRKRKEPPKPLSLVKFAASACSVTIGDGVSTPTRDHVPELM